MSAPVGWLEAARLDYVARPWVSWALAAKVPVSERLISLTDAANALVDHLSPVEAIDAAIAAEVRASERDAEVAMRLVRAVAQFVRDDGMAKATVNKAMLDAYTARGVEI